MKSGDVYQVVHDRYSDIARNAAQSSESNDEANARIAKMFGYTIEELQTASGANLGLSCGAPIAKANLKQGEIVVDLGSGGGLDVFLAAKEVGPEGKAIGVDMSEEMIAVAKRNAANKGTTNVSFVQSKLPSVALPSSQADCIVSNCVINLIPHDEKPKVFEEMFRILKPGGRVVLSDVLARKPLPKVVKDDVALYVGCVAGASQVHEYETWLKQAGFRDTLILDSKHDLNVFKQSDVGLSSTAKESCGCCIVKPKAQVQAEENAVTNTACCGNSNIAIAKENTSCCVPSSAKGTVTAKDEDLVVENLNEWVGSFMVFGCKPNA